MSDQTNAGNPTGMKVPWPRARHALPVPATDKMERTAAASTAAGRRKHQRGDGQPAAEVGATAWPDREHGERGEHEEGQNPPPTSTS